MAIGGANGGTITYSIEVDASGAVVGIKNAEKDMQAAASQAGSKSGNKLSAGWAAATGAIAGITSQIFSKVTATISQAVGSAINRVDTLNNFSKVMGNLGISSESATRVINDMSDRLQKLPTTLNDAASAVQRFTSANGDITKSEEIFLALNNAILAGGASMDTQATALEQLSQAYAKGKPDAMEWRSMLTAMPAQLKQVAQAMGYTSTAVGGDLYEAIQSGTVSMDDFMNTIIKLNKEGVGGFASFEEQAEGATSGIETSVTNMKTAIVRAVGNIINAIGSENISNALSAIGKAFESVANVVTGIINFVKENEVARDALLAFLITLGIVLLTTVVPAFIAWSAALLANPITWIILGVTALITAIILLVTHIEEVGQWFNDVFAQIGQVVSDIVDSIGKWFDDMFSGIWNGLVAIGNFFRETFQNVWNFITSIFSNIGNFFKGVWDTIVNIFSKVGTAVGDAVGGAFKAVVNGVLGFVEHFINTPMNLINGFIDLINGAFGAIGVNIGHVPTVNLPRLATGGIVEATAGGRIIMAGEGGEDEWVVPESKMSSLIDQLNARGGGETINIYVDGVFATSAQERRKVATDIIEAYNQNQKRRFANA